MDESVRMGTVDAVRAKPVRPGARPGQRMQTILGQDWKIALPVRPADGAPDGGAHLLALHQLHHALDDRVQLHQRRDDQRRPPQLPAALHQQRLLPGDGEHDHLHVLVAVDQVRDRHDDRADPAQPPAAPEPPRGNHAAALDRARDRHGARLEEHLRSAVRRPQPDPAGPRHHQAAARLAVRSADGDGQRDRGQRLEGHPVLHAAAARRPQGDRHASSSRRPRSMAPMPCSASAT